MGKALLLTPPDGGVWNTGMKLALSKLWHGEHTLRRTFWLYFIVGQWAFMLLLMLISLPVFLLFRQSLLPVMGVFALLILGYLFMAMVGVWRSAKRYDGSLAWALLAKLVMVLWAGAILLIAIMNVLVF